MQTLVVFFALAAVACGSYVPLAQPPHHPAVVLDARGRPLDTAEVINARALHLQAKALEGHYAHGAVAPLAHAAVVAPLAHSVVAPALVAAPAAVSHQSRVDVRTSPAIVSHAVAAPVLGHSAIASPLLGHGLAGHGLAGHWLHKRSLGHLAYSAPIVAHVAPSAVSHQSRVDVISSPAVVSHAVAAPVYAHAAPVVAHAAPVVAVAPAAVSHQSRVDVRTSHAAVAAPVYAHATPVVAHAAPVYAHAAPIATTYVGGSAVTHQSRVDVQSSPAVVSHASLALHGAHDNLGLSHGHRLKKRSLAPVWSIATPVVHAAPAAVSHQSRVDVISRPAVVSHSVVAPVVAHAAVTPLAHSALWSVPAAHWAQSGLLHAAGAHW